MGDKTLRKPEEKEKPDRESEAVDMFQMIMETIPFSNYWFPTTATEGTEIERPSRRHIKEKYEKQVDLLKKRQ